MGQRMRQQQSRAVVGCIAYRWLHMTRRPRKSRTDCKEVQHACCNCTRMSMAADVRPTHRVGRRTSRCRRPVLTRDLVVSRDRPT